jgi:U3 small nucleolar RNA-associated protein MPP10
VYDSSKSEDIGKPENDSALPELIVENFDNEQIWQQIELQNNGVIDNLLSKISSVMTAQDKLRLRTKSDQSDPGGKKKVRFHKKDLVNDESEEEGTDVEMEKIKSRLIDEEEEEEDDSDGSKEMIYKGNNVLDIESDDDDSETDFNFPKLNAPPPDEEESETDDENLIKKKMREHRGQGVGKKRQAPSVVDDRFFKLADMEVFLEQEDAKEERRMRGEESDSDDEDINLFADIPSDDEEVGFDESDGLGENKNTLCEVLSFFHIFIFKHI